MRQSHRLSQWLMLLLAGCLVWLPAFVGAEEASGASDAPSKPHHISAKVCKQCHETIYEQWQGSMHAKSTALEDPIHGGFYRFVIGNPAEENVRTKKGAYPVCLHCHSPSAAQDGKTDLDSKVSYSEGVNCMACHLLKKYNGLDQPDGSLKYGVATYDVSAKAIQGSSGKNYTTNPTAANQADPNFHPFPLEGNSMMRTSNACMGCHDRRNNSKGVPLCVTGKEYEKSSTFVACQTCHMPKTNGVTDHSLAGGHGTGKMRSSLILDASLEANADSAKATATLTNPLPHAFPTGAPFRNFYLKVTAYDQQENVVWRNFENHPMKEDPKSLFVVVLGDTDGKPTGPPTATQILKDARLQPNETRIIEYDIPVAGVTRVRVEALYNLVLPPHVNMLTKIAKEDPSLPTIEDDLFSPKPVAVAEASL